MGGADFSDSALFLSLRLLLPHLGPTWQAKIPTTEGRRRKCCLTPTKRKKKKKTHLNSRTLRLCCTAYCLYLCKSCDGGYTGSTSPSFRCVRLLAGSLKCCVCVYTKGLHKQRESGQQRHTRTSLHLVNADAPDTERFVVFLVCAAENGTFLLGAILKCCDAQNLWSGVI